MLTTIETNKVLFRTLTQTDDFKKVLSGGIYTKKRPDNSEKEDVVINTITLTTELPQTGTSNINIYVPDLKVKIDGVEQRQPNDERLDVLVTMVYDILRAANIEGLMVWTTNETPLSEPSVNQHYINLRLDWNIHK